MAVAAYYTWDRAGRPLSPAQPVVDVIARMKAAYPRAASTFSYYANAAHYEAAVPQDHTPYSVDGWPLDCQQWWVYATDIMHNPGVGVDCNVLFPYWLAEAKAGRFPGLKYLIWQAHIYDVRHGWQPQASSGHYDHIHLSFRTDWQTRGLGSWSLIPGAPAAPKPPPEDDMPFCYWNRGTLYVKWGSGPAEAQVPAGADAIKAEFRRRGIAWADVQLSDEAHAGLQGAKPTPVTVDAAAVAAALATNADLLAAIAKAVNDDDHRRSES